MKSPSFRLPAVRTLAFAALLGAAAQARATTYTWTGNGGSGNWNTAANWQPGQPQSDRETALVFGASSQLVTNQNIGNFFLLNSLLFNSNAGAYTLGGGRLDFSRTSANVLPTITQNSGSLVTINNAFRINDLLTVGGTGNLVLGGALEGQAGLTMAGAGTLTLSGNNANFSQTLTLQSGTVSLGSANALGTSGTLSFTGGSIQYSAANQTDYSSRFSQAANQNYGIDTNGQNVTFTRGLTSSGGSLTKLGAGTLTLSGASTYTGTTTVSGGTLAIGTGGSIGGGGSINVGTGATLAASGTGSIVGSSSLTLNGTSAAPASLTVADSAVLNLGQFTVGNGGTGVVTQSGGTFTTNALYLGGNLGGSGVYTLSEGSLSTGLAYVGNSGAGTFTQSGGTFSTGTSALILGNNPSGSGAYTLSGTGSLSTGLAYVGGSGAGTFTQSGGTFTTGTNALYLGGASGSSGAYTLSAGSLSTGNAYVGNSGTGTFTQSGGTFSTGGKALYLGRYANSSGTYTLGGTGSISASTAYVGGSGTGTFTQTGGTFTTSLDLILGNDPGGSGTYVLGAGSLSTRSILVGSQGTGTFTQNGGVSTSGGVLVGGGGSGTYVLNAGSLSAGESYVGQSGAGTFTQNGGAFTTNGGTLYLGFNANVSGTYLLTGGTLTTGRTQVSDDANASSFTQTGGVHVTGVLGLSGGNGSAAAGSSGTYTLGGGTLTTGSVVNNDGAFATTGTSTFNFNGGTLRASGNNAAFIQGLSAANVQAGGARIDTNGFNLTVGQNLLHDPALGSAADGGLTKLGAGTLTLSGTNTFTGPVSIIAGILGVSGDASLGGGDTVTVNGTGQLQFAASTATSRTYNLGVSTLSVASGQTLTLAGATINGGFLAGPGTDALGNGATLNAVTTQVGSTLTQASGGTATLSNTTIRGALTQTGGTLALDNATGTTSSRITVGGTVNASGTELDGVTTVASGGALNTSGTSLYFGGGARATVNGGGTLAAGAGTSIELNGALLVNNGTQTGALNVNYGSTAKGSGTFGDVTINDGGHFGTNAATNGGGSGNAPNAPGFAVAHLTGGDGLTLTSPAALAALVAMGPQAVGTDASPGTINVGNFTLNANSNLSEKVQNAAGAAGVGYDLAHASGKLMLNGSAAPGSQINLTLSSLNATGNPGPAQNFNPMQSYQFTLVQADGGIVGYVPGEFAIDYSAFTNDLQGGIFDVIAQGNNLLLTFTPVPEPGTWALLGTGGVALLIVARAKARRRAA